MSSPSLMATGQLAGELFTFLRETDPASWSDRVETQAGERWADIRRRIDELGAAKSNTALDQAVANIAELARESPLHADAPQPKSRWMELRARLMPAYERLAAQLRAHSVLAPTLRPTNWNRIAFHVTSAVGALLLMELVLSRAGTLWATALFAGTFWFLETGRALSERMNDVLMRFKFFKLIIHPHEVHRVNSATWYATALFLLALFSPPFASAAALMVLGIGDPAAGLVGRRWGRHVFGGGRTLEGSLAFVIGGTLAAFAILSLWHGGSSPAVRLLIAFIASLAGAGAEAVSRRVDDNFSVPVAAASAAWLVATIFGVAL